MAETIQKSETEKIKQAEKVSIKEGSATAVMDGFGYRYITPYALALGSSNFFIALINTVPNFLGNLFQLHTLRLLKKRKRKTIVFTSAFLQALLWIPLIITGILYIKYPEISSSIPFFLLIFYSMIIITGAVSFPAWNSWMKDIITLNPGSFFGTRNKTVNLIVIISMFIAAAMLSFFNNLYFLSGFFIIFFIAMIGRLIASYFLLKQYEPEYIYSSNHYVSFKTFLKGITKDNFGIFVIFVSLISFATAVSGPFFAVYMLKHLNFTYIQFTIVTVGSVLTTILFLPFWGKFSDKYGNIEVIKMTGVLIAITPLLWAMTFFLTNLNINTIVVYLVFVEFFSGFIWSGFNLSSAIFIYDAISKEKIAASTTYFNIINSFGATIGAILGGLIGSLSFSIFGIDTIIWIMILSSVLRIIIALLINPKIKEVRNVPNFEFKNKIKNGLKKRGAFIWRYIGFKAIRIN